MKTVKYLWLSCSLLLAACYHDTQVSAPSFRVTGQEQVADKQGWYHFAGFDFKGKLVKGAPHGAGICRESGKESTCEFDRGARIDQKHLQSVAEAETYRKKEQAERERWEYEQAAERRRQEKESEQAMRETFTNLNKDMAAFSADLAAQDRETNRLIEQAQREKQAKREAEQRARENEQLEARRERVMRERAALDRQAEERREAHVQQQEQANRQAQADAQSAALAKRQAELAKQQVEQRERERKAAEDARMAKAAEQERKQEQERKRKEEARLKEAERKKEVESHCVLQGTGLCRGAARTERKGGMFWVIQPNQCGYRLYVGVCIKTKSGRDDCGADSIQPGRTTSFWHASDDATGEYTVRSVGVLKGGDDWSCSGEQRKAGLAD